MRTPALFAALILSLTACSNGSGFLNLFPPKPSGTINLVLVGGNGKTMDTTASSPQAVSGGFSLSVSEQNYSGYFTATIVSYSSPATGPCYTPGGTSNSTLTFAPSSATGCSGLTVEGIQVTDDAGHSTTQFVQGD
ncbi:MAG: hypothetical protein ACREMP_00530 [Candidatus Tyrphobacter sp.]